MSQPIVANEVAVEHELKQCRKRRAVAPSAEIREAEKMVVNFFERLDGLGKSEIERLQKQFSLAIEASQRREAEMKADFEKMRSDLNTLTNGMAEQLVRRCGDEEMLARFRRCGWRV